MINFKEFHSLYEEIKAEDRHENLMKWFGNSVTHEGGKPKVYYTGTSKDKDFKSFNVGRHGAWFTSSPHEASTYSTENDSMGHKFTYDGKIEKTNTASRVIPAHIRAENPYRGDIPHEYRTHNNYKNAQSDFFDTLRAKGHDSWIPDHANGNIVVVLKHPNQIKSAIGNKGSFSTTKNNIHETNQ